MPRLPENLGNAAGDPDTTIDTTVSLGVITTRVSVPAYNFVATGFFTRLLQFGRLRRMGCHPSTFR